MKENKAQLEKRVGELEARIQSLERDLIHDPLTGLKTRAFFEEELNIYMLARSQNERNKRKQRFGFSDISVIFFDIDRFKNINDRYGHDVGDVVLRRVAATIQSNLRAGDILARWGGEELVASLLGANEDDAVIKAEKIRGEIEALVFPEAEALRLTISSGVASSEKDMKVDELIKRVDQALYRAKDSGRNKVVAYSKITTK